jgi:excisionase family DNA binding protein
MAEQLDGARERLKAQAQAAGGEQPFFTPRTLAERLSISERTVRQMLIDGRIASYRIGGSRRVAPADLEAYLAKQRQAASR